MTYTRVNRKCAFFMYIVSLTTKNIYINVNTIWYNVRKYVPSVNREKNTYRGESRDQFHFLLKYPMIGKPVDPCHMYLSYKRSETCVRAYREFNAYEFVGRQEKP